MYITRSPGLATLRKYVSPTTILVTLYCTRILQTVHDDPLSREALSEFTNWQSVFGNNWDTLVENIQLDLNLQLTIAQIRFALEKCIPYVLFIYFKFIDLKLRDPKWLNYLLRDWFPHLLNPNPPDAYNSSLFPRIETDNNFYFIFSLDIENKQVFASGLHESLDTLL